MLDDALQLLPALDWLALGVLAIAMVMGAWRGLLYGVISILGWVAAFLAAGHLGRLAGMALPLGDERLRTIAGAALIFVLVLFASGATAHLVRRLAAAVGMRPVDRILGAAFGLLQALLLELGLVVMLGSTPLAWTDMWKNANSVRILQGMWTHIAPMLPALPQPGSNVEKKDGSSNGQQENKEAASGSAAAAPVQPKEPVPPAVMPWRKAPEVVPAPQRSGN